MQLNFLLVLQLGLVFLVRARMQFDWNILDRGGFQYETDRTRKQNNPSIPSIPNADTYYPFETDKTGGGNNLVNPNSNSYNPYKTDKTRGGNNPSIPSIPNADTYYPFESDKTGGGNNLANPNSNSYNPYKTDKTRGGNNPSIPSIPNADTSYPFETDKIGGANNLANPNSNSYNPYETDKTRGGNNPSASNLDPHNPYETNKTPGGKTPSIPNLDPYGPSNTDKIPEGNRGINPSITSLDPYDKDQNKDDDIFKKPENVDCTDECVPFYQCNNGSIITSGVGLIDMRKNSGPCGNAFLTCCQLEDVTKDRVSVPKPAAPKPMGCGYSNPNGVGFEITGTVENEAQFAEFPWMVSIYKANEMTPNGKERPSCGGALIHPQAVITAAHCVSDRWQRYRIHVGDWDLNRAILPIPYKVADVDAVTIHDNYYAGAAQNDIAFLHLKTPIKSAENVGTICLPPQNFHHKMTRCYSTGWGQDKFGARGKFVDVMKKIDLPFVPRTVCQENLRKTRLGAYFILHTSFMCAGGEKDKDVCKGDGGGPLICPVEQESSRYYQAGIVSWGVGCGDEDVPGVYIDVAQFRQWIDTQMFQYGLDPSTYTANSYEIL